MPQANCKIHMSSRAYVSRVRGCLPAPPGLTHTGSLRRGQPLVLLPVEALHRVGRLAPPTPPLCAGHACTGEARPASPQ